MKNSAFLLIFLCTSLFVQAAAERNLLAQYTTPEKLAGMLVMNRHWVPYPDYSNRTGWDKLLGDHKNDLIKRGEKQLDYQWQVIKATDYLEYERSGERNIMQNPNSDNNNALSDLVLAELAEGKGRFLDQIINGVFYNCERTSWVLSAHLTAQLSKRTLPDHTEQVIDLGSGELGAFLSWVYYFFHEEFDQVNPVISKRLYDEIKRKIIDPYRNIDRFWWMAFQPRPDGMVNNWNPWTNFNCLQSIALLEDDREQLSKDLYRSMLSVDKFINYVNEDGACEEGPSYWGHAAGKLYDYLQLVDYITDGGVTLFNHPMIKDMGEYISRSYVGNNWVVNFADASAKFSAPESLIFRYGKAVNSKEMIGFATYLAKQKESTLTYGTDFFRVLESLYYDAELKQSEAVHVVPDIIVYPETQFYYFKNKHDFFLAAKGGYNAESHNHNDAGTFSLWIDKTPVLIDAGVGTYTRQTFGPERYSIWTMRSNYHNLPSVNGVEQVFGKDYKAADIRVNEKRKTLSLDIAGAYPEKASVKQWIRSYQLKDKELIVKDKFNLKKTLQFNEIHFMLWGDINIKGGKVNIDVDGKKAVLLFDNNTFEASLETISLPDVRLSRVWGNEIYRLTLKAKKKVVRGEYVYKIISE
ncbi:MAG: heparinase II/III-family protein [Paludibacter sp.]|nr:heparinase II/III-family protein [Paludibacter sp.]MDD4428205.1 heparinase II/III-family protein [Paludibacter sp.]